MKLKRYTIKKKRKITSCRHFFFHTTEIYIIGDNKRPIKFTNCIHIYIFFPHCALFGYKLYCHLKRAWKLIDFVYITMSNSVQRVSKLRFIVGQGSKTRGEASPEC